MENLRKPIIKIIKEVTGLELKASQYVKSFSSLGIDSFTALEILVSVEQNFKIKIDELEAIQIKNFSNLLEVVKLQLKNG